MKKIIYATLFLFMIMTLVACQDSNDTSNKIDVSVSIIPEKAFVDAVGKELVDVHVVVPAGSSPATYEPTPQEAVELEKADIFFGIGVPTEADNILPLVSDDTKEVLLHEEVAKNIDEIMVNGKRDVHIWLSIERVIKMVEIIRDELSLLSPEHKDTFTDNAAAYISSLNDLKTYADEQLSDLENNKFIVYHPAFRYLATEFGLEMFALEQDGKEADAQRIAEMIDFAKTEGIKVIFYQSEFSSVQAESFAEEIGGQTMQLAPLAYDYINNLESMIDLLHEVMSNEQG